MKTTPMKGVIAACFLAGATLASGALAQSTFNNGVNGTASPGNSGNENLTANANGVTNSTLNTANTPAANNVPCQSAILTAGCGGTGGPPVTGVPEPETYALMAAGLGMIGYLGRRRKKKENERSKR
jgi:hypothetical protein